MNRQIILLILVCAALAGPVTAADRKAPRANNPVHPQFREYLGFPFRHLEFKRLKEKEREAFFAVYPPDLEMQKRMNIEACVAGEAPPLAKALKQFPLHYPKVGRMMRVSGVLEWQRNEKNKIEGLIFRTKDQCYQVREYFLLHRLEQMGFTKQSAPTKATMDASWQFGQLGGLFLLYVEHLKLNGSAVGPAGKGQSGR